MAGTEQLRVGVIMGSDSDLSTVQETTDALQAGGLAWKDDYETRVVSAHRTSRKMREYAEKAEERGLQAIIAFAGGSAHLQGMTGSETTVPVLGVGVTSSPGIMNPALGSIIRMPKGKPLASFQAGRGAYNAGLFASRMVAQAHAKADKIAVIAGDEDELASLAPAGDALRSLGYAERESYQELVLPNEKQFKEFCDQAAVSGLAAIITRSSHRFLSQRTAMDTTVPVLGVALPRSSDEMSDELSELINVDNGVVMASFLGKAGVFNAGLYAGRIAALTNLDLRQRIKDYDKELEIDSDAKDTLMERFGNYAYAKIPKDELQEMISEESAIIRARETA